MSKVVKGFFFGLLLITLVITPACRKKVTPKPEVVPDTMATAPPVVPDPPPVTETVAPRTDFVQENKVTEEPLPSDLEELNRVAQSRGYIRDAFFGYDESALPADAQEALTASATWLKANPQYNLLIEGHCDERGTEQYNLALGDRRANTVRDYLMTLGVDGSRMRTVSYGEERPFEDGHDESAWAKNRRGHLVLVGK